MVECAFVRYLAGKWQISVRRGVFRVKSVKLRRTVPVKSANVTCRRSTKPDGTLSIRAGTATRPERLREIPRGVPRGTYRLWYVPRDFCGRRGRVREFALATPRPDGAACFACANRLRSARRTDLQCASCEVISRCKTVGRVVSCEDGVAGARGPLPAGRQPPTWPPLAPETAADYARRRPFRYVVDFLPT